MRSGASSGLIGNLRRATDESGFEQMGSRAIAAGIGCGSGGGNGGGQPIGIDNRERSSQCEHHGNRKSVEVCCQGS